MGILTSNSKVPKSYVNVNVEFTQEESEAIATSLEHYGPNADADAPEGTTFYVTPKVKDGMRARALVEHVEDLIGQLEDFSGDKAAAIVEKAIKSELKAYAIHNLPVYLFQAAGMFELIGDLQNARKFLGLFLQAQEEFKPDLVDTIFLNQTGLDLPRAIALAKEKCGSYSKSRKISMGIWNPKEHTNDDNVRFSWLRAVEWGSWPIFISQPIAPIALLFFPWWSVIMVTTGANVIWSLFVRYQIVIPALALLGAVFVRLKWLSCPIAAYLLWHTGSRGTAALALLWPLLVMVMPRASTRVGDIQGMFMECLGYKLAQKA